MQRIMLDRVKQVVVVPEREFNVTVKWVANEDGAAIVRLTTDVGIACMLNISRDVHGSIFDFMHQGKGVEFVIENVVSCGDEITQMIFLLG